MSTSSAAPCFLTGVVRVSCYRSRTALCPLRQVVRRYRVCATAEPSAIPSAVPPAESGNRSSALLIRSTRAVETLWHFSRPHTIWGTVLAVLSLHVVAWRSVGWLGLASVRYLMEALTPALLLNVFIVGLNQLHDIAIDRINKPHLPLPSHRLTTRAAWSIVLVSLIFGLAFCLAPTANAPLCIVLIGSTALGAAYSSPPLRLKRWPVLASACILAVRGVLVNACFYLHAVQRACPMALPPLLRFCVAFFVLFGIVIALLKDVPDIPGDRTYGIHTFSVRAGPHAVFRLCVATLVVAFLASACAFYIFASPSILGRAAVLAQIAVAAYLLVRARQVDPALSTDATKYYMLTWKAFYLQYLMLAIAV